MMSAREAAIKKLGETLNGLVTFLAPLGMKVRIGPDVVFPHIALYAEDGSIEAKLYQRYYTEIVEQCKELGVKLQEIGATNIVPIQEILASSTPEERKTLQAAVSDCYLAYMREADKVLTELDNKLCAAFKDPASVITMTSGPTTFIGFKHYQTQLDVAKFWRLADVFHHKPMFSYSEVSLPLGGKSSLRMDHALFQTVLAQGTMATARMPE